MPFRVEARVKLFIRPPAWYRISKQQQEKE
jgi:hypothetical protein